MPKHGKLVRNHLKDTDDSNFVSKQKNLPLEVECANIFWKTECLGGTSAECAMKSFLDIRTIIDEIDSFIDTKFPESSDGEREIIRDNIEIALLEGRQSRRLRNYLVPPNLVENELDLPAPVRDLRKNEIAAIRQVGLDYPWKDRAKSDLRTPVEWIIDYYGSWIPGLLTSHIRQADLTLYNYFMRQLGQGTVPSTLDIPTSDEQQARQRAAARRADPDRRADMYSIVKRWTAQRAQGYYHQRKHPNGEPHI